MLSPDSQLSLSDWAPDYGPATFVPSWGASVVGARKFLIAYNVNLLGTKEQATRISFGLRESGGYTGKKVSLSGVECFTMLRHKNFIVCNSLPIHSSLVD